MTRRAKVDVEGDLRRLILARLPVKKREYILTLEALPIRNLLIRYFNWVSRLIPAQRREVLRSQELGKNPVYLRFKADIDRLLGKIAIGADLMPHLSTQIEIGYEEDRQGRPGMRSLDLLLNDWGVHHLHFGHTLRPDGFVERPKDKSELLFVIFQPTTAFVLDIFTHDDWIREDVVRIAVRNWPVRNLFSRLNGVVGLERSISEDDRKKLRNGHVNATIEIDGEVFMGRGLSSAGTSLEVTIMADRLLKCLDAYCADECVIVSAMKVQADNHELRIPNRPTFEVIEARSELRYGFALREQKSGATLWVS